MIPIQKQADAFAFRINAVGAPKLPKPNDYSFLANQAEEATKNATNEKNDPDHANALAAHMHDLAGAQAPNAERQQYHSLMATGHRGLANGIEVGNSAPTSIPKTPTAPKIPTAPKVPAVKTPKPLKAPGASPTTAPDDDDDMITLYRGIKFNGSKEAPWHGDRGAYRKEQEKNDQEYRDKINATHKNPSSVGPLVQRTLGNHWTPNPEAAHQFASDDSAGYKTLQDHPKLPYKYDPKKSAIHYTAKTSDSESSDSHGMVVSAKFHKKDIIDPKSAEGKKYADAYEIYGGEGFQNEHTIRNGTPVKIEHAYYTSNTADDPHHSYRDDTHARTVRNTEIDPSTFHQHYVAKLKFM